jgi:hypothetical protein
MDWIFNSADELFYAGRFHLSDPELSILVTLPGYTTNPFFFQIGIIKPNPEATTGSISRKNVRRWLGGKGNLTSWSILCRFPSRLPDGAL